MPRSRHKATRALGNEQPAVPAELAIKAAGVGGSAINGPPASAADGPMNRSRAPLAAATHDSNFPGNCAAKWPRYSCETPLPTPLAELPKSAIDPSARPPCHVDFHLKMDHHMSPFPAKGFSSCHTRKVFALSFTLSLRSSRRKFLSLSALVKSFSARNPSRSSRI